LVVMASPFDERCCCAVIPQMVPWERPTPLLVGSPERPCRKSTRRCLDYQVASAYLGH
jgi:hypothetical protein